MPWSREAGDRRPAAVHYAGLLIGALALMYFGRHEYFFRDDWAFVVPTKLADINAPHGGHWTTTPHLMFLVLRHFFGINGYLPFLALSVLAHLVAVHAVWRIMLRCGVLPWIATGVGLLMVFMRGGGQNIFWAFQVGFVGAVALGLIAIILVDRERLGLLRGVAAAVVLVLSLTFAGTALPVALGFAVLALVRHGIVRAALLLLPSVVAYGTWRLAAPKVPVTDYSASGGFGRVVMTTVDYASAMVVDALGSFAPAASVPGLGVVLLVLLVAWAGRRSAAFVGPAAPAYALLLSALAFALLIGYARSAIALETAGAGRYVHACLLLLAPALALMLSQLVTRGWAHPAAVLAVLGAVTLYGAASLDVEAAHRGVTQSEGRGRVAAAADILQSDDAARQVDHGQVPDPLTAPDLTLGDLLDLMRSGTYTGGSFDLQETLDVGPVFWLDQRDAGHQPQCTRERTERVPTATVPAGATVLVRSSSTRTVDVRLVKGSMLGVPRQAPLPHGWNAFENTGHFAAKVSSPAGIVSCAVPVA